MNPQKAAGQDTAIKKRAQLPFHKPGYVAVAQPLPPEEILQLRGKNAIENALRGIPGTVIGRSLAHREILPSSLEVSMYRLMGLP